MRYELKIYADSVEELMSILSKSEFTSVEQNTLDHKFKLACRKNKAWTEFELNFLTANYMAKNARWIAGKLQRNPIAISQKLFEMYKKGLPKKRAKVKTL